ncbi:multicopper oxidase domain-containing protein [Acidimicrobiaceae bacterium AH-315-P05]|nr:multicopper oxidase domain-containing protein [Acidimicrobiaceae bacterium AH-315-P05]
MTNNQVSVPPAAPSDRPDKGPGAGWVLALLLGLATIVVIGFVGVATIALAFDDDSSSAGGGSGGSSSAVPATTLQVDLSEFAIGGNLIAPAGDITLAATNKGGVVHNVAVRELGIASEDLNPGRSGVLELSRLDPGTYTVFCDIPGHETAGMKATLTVTGDSVGAQLVVAVDEEPDWEALDAAMKESILAFPAETEGSGNPVLEPTEILADGTKVFDLTAERVQWEVEPGKFVDAWTYNGVVPAPQLILDRGDKIQVRILNNLPMGTDVHWHGVHTPNDMDGVAPLTQDIIEGNGGTFTYEFTAEDDAIGMYHSHHHGQMQVVNGMFGVIRIGDNPVPYGETISGVTIPEDVEFAADMPMVLNDAGTIGFSLNGKSFPATEPLVISEGDWVSVSYFNEGLQSHPMHLHQFPQLVYAKDGIPLEVPYWADTINIAPGERYTVMFRADNAGTWVWHCHILTHVEREEGMFGMVTAIVVQPNPDFDPDENPVKPSNWRLTDNHDADTQEQDQLDS